MMTAMDTTRQRGELLHDEPLARHTSWRAGGPARCFYTPADLDDLANFLAGLPVGEPLLWIGLGSNLLVREARARCPGATHFRIGVLLGLGDSHGPAAIDWTLGSLGPLDRGDIQPLRFGRDRRARPTIPFDFSDQHSLMRRGYPPVETRLALASPLIFPWSLRLLARMAGHPRLRKALNIGDEADPIRTVRSAGYSLDLVTADA